MAEEKYKVSEEFVKELGQRIWNSMDGYIIIPIDEYLTSIGIFDECAISNNVHRSIEESINKVGPADCYFKVSGISNGYELKFSLIPKNPWYLIEEDTENKNMT